MGERLCSDSYTVGSLERQGGRGKEGEREREMGNEERVRERESGKVSLLPIPLLTQRDREGEKVLYTTYSDKARETQREVKKSER